MASGEGGAGAGGEEEFSKMLMGMMEQLTNKEILYEPMKELHDKFPAWLAANREKTGAEDLKRYEDQHALVNEIVARFEASTYTDSNAADREYIVERMQKVSCAQKTMKNTWGKREVTFLLTGPRIGCRSWARRRRIWWEISTQHKRPLPALMSNVTHSSKRRKRGRRNSSLYLHDHVFLFHDLCFFFEHAAFIYPCVQVLKTRHDDSTVEEEENQNRCETPNLVPKRPKKSQISRTPPYIPCK